MHKFIRILFAAWLLCLNSESSAVDVEKQAQQLLDAGAVGFAMALVNKDGIYWSESHGFADLEAQRPMTIDTVMNIASISKTVTGTSLMILVEQGRLDLDRNVSDYLPFTVVNPRHADKEITTRQLLTHTSSIVDRGELYESDTSYFPGSDNPVRLGDFVREYLSSTGEFFEPTNFGEYAPGTKRRYSNIAYGLAGYLVEVLSGRPLNIFSRDEIFNPLEMQDSGWMLAEIDVAQHARLYEIDKHGLSVVEWYGLVTWPDGGVRTSVRDLSRFVAAMIGSGQFKSAKILGYDRANEMFKPQFAAGLPLAAVEEAPSQRQAITWSYRTNYSSKPVVGHGGNDPGVTTYAYFDPGTGQGVVLLINTSSELETFDDAATAMIRALLVEAAK